LILYGWRRLLTKDQAPTRVEWKSAAIIGLLLLLGGNGFVVWAETRIPSGITALILATTPLWMILIDWINPKQKIRPNLGTVLGIGIGFVGILLLVGPKQVLGAGATLDSAGVIAILLAALFWSIGTIYGRNASLPKSPLLGTGMEMLMGSLGLLIVGTLTGEWSKLELATISTQSMVSFLYLILIGSLVGFTAYSWLFRVAPTPLVSTYAYVNPLIAVVLGFLLADEALTWQIVVSGLIIIGSVILINLTKPKVKQASVA
jgi:drug/metabolite transporter (DMT)-like permease